LNNRDWSLVFFTTLAQMSVGIMLCTTLAVCFTDSGQLVIETGLRIGNPVFLALVLMGVATFISFLHLGSPSNAPNSLKNLSGSWLSREILAINFYSLSLLLLMILSWRSGSIENIKPLFILSSILGLVLLWMMIRIYVMPTIPAWNVWNTPLSFFSTSLSLGLLTTIVLQTAGLVNISGHVMEAFALSATVVLLIEMIFGILHQSRLIKMDTGIEQPVFDRGPYHQVFLIRMLFLGIAIVGMVLILSALDLAQGTTAFLWISLVSGLVIGQELMGRLLFYSSYFRLGV
jgi:anaerobic dimethyl sulfoxide reductase subunit C (anchor subunit)